MKLSVEALMCLKGVNFVTAVTFVAEIGDLICMCELQRLSPIPPTFRSIVRRVVIDVERLCWTVH
jgi:hypothetical protein